MDASVTSTDTDTDAVVNATPTGTTRVKLTDEEYWKMKRAKNREKEKQNKLKFETKEEYLDSEEWRKNQERQKRRRKWKDLAKEEIEFHKPEIVIDLSYSDVMVAREQGSAITQLVHMYGTLKAADRPLKTHFCSVTGDLKERLNKVDVPDWKVWTHEESFDKAFDPESLIYLSPDSPNILTELEEDKVYVIGGLVDHNKLKGLSYKKATDLGLRTARLPLSELLHDKPNTSLNQNHVYNIITDFAETGNLEEALKKHTPSRKIFRKQAVKGAAKENEKAETQEKEEENGQQ
eukprot:TRINITY_DN7661_c0_g1_i2.p1 TRINITY_DN7661_c0_g1~~TRINITY_DN7661_c0_g1_i2.p1  ORF type:complete len:292 (-),score=88.36 TRINITY_DN7661_c0_g1_i2:3-878(-)